MKKIGLAVLGLVVLVAITPFIAPPIVRETIHNLQCPEVSPPAGCRRNEKTIGHIRSDRGEFSEARKWYARGANRGDAVAMFHLAWVHEQMAVQSMIQTARHLWDLSKSDTLDSAKELTDMISSLASRLRGADRSPTDPNWNLAKYWYRRSADMGFAPSMNNLGQMLLSGMDGQRDIDAAYRWHVAAAEAGNPVGQMNVAVAYSFGHGVKIDSEQYEKWSTWTPSEEIKEDLSEPTLARTKLFGSTVPEHIRKNIRIAAKSGEPFKITLSKVKPDPSLPTFRRVGENQ